MAQATAARVLIDYEGLRCVACALLDSAASAALESFRLSWRVVCGRAKNGPRCCSKWHINVTASTLAQLVDSQDGTTCHLQLNGGSSSMSDGPFTVH
eukprot:794354-Pyramimonas_sp.AAC.1